MNAPIRVREAGLTLAESADSVGHSGATVPVLNRLPLPTTRKTDHRFSFAPVKRTSG